MMGKTEKMDIIPIMIKDRKIVANCALICVSVKVSFGLSTMSTEPMITAMNAATVTRDTIIVQPQ